jgi:hypothetical protein
MMDINTLANEILSLFEIEEARSLNWGFVNTLLDVDGEFENLLKNKPDLYALWQQSGYSQADITKNLMKRRLLFKMKKYHYRTRFAETLRLTSHLRQRFSEKDWMTAPQLVSDFRVELRRRSYPRRDIACNHLLEQLEDFELGDVYLAAVEALLQKPDGTMLTLSEFQQDAILRQVRSLQGRDTTGIVIGAGTGAGKTKAFYIPAMAYIAQNLKNAKARVQALAIYPRVELLKDQLLEALSEAGKLESLLKQAGKRGIVIGAYYGDTPYNAQHFSRTRKPSGWKQDKRLGGWICPYVRYEGRDVYWSDADIEAETQANKKKQYGTYARLRDAETHEVVFDDSQLLLCRDQMLQQPPDIFFTTTEMLNRRLSGAAEHALFGIDSNEAPELMLMDEIHTYEGLAGAQTAYLLRRWQHARQLKRPQRLCIVGLSATLSDAETFFSKLTGIPKHLVHYIAPHPDSLQEQGMEYNVVLKGDPVSQTSLLSTSVQAAMLLARVLDPLKNNDLSNGAFGTKLFAFTDKLDVINRWYQIQEDAERNKRLSRYRDIKDLTDDEIDRRHQHGQVWQMPRGIGHDLTQELKLERTSSQDRGVDSSANMVIATSTLEVGFNDPYVGAVIQHKAPRSMASFLQRKGRAGRRAEMRPWMMVITSAYGRDRWAFQHAELLFNPSLPPMDLPIGNIYVLKMQAAFTLMDWLTIRLKTRVRDIDVWDALSTQDYKDKKNYTATQQKAIREVLQNLLSGDELADFALYLSRALDLDAKDTGIMNMLLWGEPRPLMLDVVPTLLRQLETDWGIVRDGQSLAWEDTIIRQPLPDYVPSSLFADLNLPELLIDVPHQFKWGAEVKHEGINLIMGMVEFAPGNVNLRYVDRRIKEEAHWLALPEQIDRTRNRFSLSLLNIEWKEAQRARQVQVGDETYALYRPKRYILDTIPKEVKQASHSRLIWRGSFVVGSQFSESEGLALSLTPNSAFSQFFTRTEAYLRERGTWLEVSRLAIGVEVQHRYTNGTSDPLRKLYFEDFADADRPDKLLRPAALGFWMEVDALACQFVPLDSTKLLQHPHWKAVYKHLRPEFFRYSLHNDTRLRELDLSSFTIDWLWQLETSMLVATAVARHISLQQAVEVVSKDRYKIADRTLKVIFQQQSDEDEDDRGRLFDSLLEYQSHPTVINVLSDYHALLWEAAPDGLAEWLQTLYSHSLAATLFNTILRLLPDIDSEDLNVDIDGTTIWISETAPGSVGIIAKLVQIFNSQPRAIEMQFLDALRHCERQQLASNLFTISSLLQTEPDRLSGAFTNARQETDLRSVEKTRQTLSNILDKAGIAVTRSLMVAMNTKFLRPNSDSDTDSLIASLVTFWQEAEAELNISIDLRVMAVAALRHPAIKTQLDAIINRINPDEKAQEAQLFNLLQSLLWLDCHDSCPYCIELWQPYQEFLKPSRELLLLLIAAEAQTVTFGASDWQITAAAYLTQDFRVDIRCEQDDLADCKAALLDMLTAPVEVAYQIYYPEIERIEREQGDWIISLILRERFGR